MNGPLQPPGAPQTLPVDVTNELLRRSRASNKSMGGNASPSSSVPSFDCSSSRTDKRWRSRRCSYRGRSPWKPRRRKISAPRAALVALGILAVHCLSAIPNVQSEYNYCAGKANQADTDGGEAEGDGILNAEEFATMVYNVTNGTLDFFTAPGAVPDAVTGSFSSLVPEGAAGLALSNASLAVEFCTGLYESLLSFYGLAYNGVSCLSAVEFGQGNNPRITSDEYARFVYKLSGGKFGSLDKGMALDELPPPLSDVFYVYEVFDFENATNEYYQGVCSETSVAILVSASYDPPRPPTPPPSGAPGTMAPTGMPVPAMPDDFRVSCQTALIVGDSIERDDRISEDEYVRFISRLVPNGAVTMSSSFASIPVVLQASFQTLALNQSYIDVSGSKPNSSPTADQTANLEHICVETYAAVLAFEDGSSLATSSPSLSPNTNSTDVSNDDLASDWILTEEAYADCKLNMMYSDLNRDNVLDDYEYLRFINRSINSTTSTFSSPADLPELFQSDFQALSDGGGGIDVAGSKPAPSPTSAQDNHLKSVCRVTGKSVSVYLGGGGSNNNGTVSPIDAFAQECVDALSVADRDSNGVMDHSEYLRFVNKLMGTTFTDFDSLTDTLKVNYETILKGGSDGVSIDGVSDGTLTTTERDQISFVCSETQKALNTSTSEINDLQDLSDEDFQQCMKVLGVSDVNSNGWLEPIEYVGVVNLLTNQKFKGSTFSDLDKLFRVSYEKSLGSNPFVDVAGAKEGIEATDDQLKNLKNVCVGLLYTVQVFEKPTNQQLDSCISLLQPRFLDDKSLSDDDYLWLVHKLAPDKWTNASSVQELPFVVGDNYEWVKYGGNSIDLSKVGDGSALNVSKQLNWTCTRTIVTIGLALDVLAESRGVPLDFCTIPISFSDVNADNSLDQQEFQSLIDHFSGNAWADDDYSSLDLSIQKLYNDYIDVRTEMIPIAGSKPGANASVAESEYLKTFCGQVESAVKAARSNTLFHESCVNVLRVVDEDADSKLSPQEYTTFLFDLAGLNALDDSFDDLDPELQSNYDRFKRASNSDQINLNSTSTVNDMCKTTKDSLGKVQESSATPDQAEGSSSIGLLAMAGIAAGIASAVFGTGVAIYCCWARRTDRESKAELQKAQPECSPYSDYDPEAHVSLKPSSRSSGDGKTEDISEASAAEQFEDEPGPAVGASNVEAIDAMEDATSEHFEDEHVARVVDAQKAPVYIDSDYGNLQGDDLEFDAAPFNAPNGDMEWSPPDSDPEEFHAFAAATPPTVDLLSFTGPETAASRSDPVLTNDVSPVNPFEEVSTENWDEVCDLPRVNPFGEEGEADRVVPPPQSPQRPQAYDFDEAPLGSPSRDSANYSAKSSPRHAPPSPPQRTPSNSSHPVTPGGGSVSTRERRNLPNSSNRDEDSDARATRIDDTSSERHENERWTDEVILVSPLEGTKKPTVAEAQLGETNADAMQLDSGDDESSESESESQPEDEDASASDEEESDSEYDEGDDASSEADTIDDSLRPNRSSVDAQRQPYYKEIKGLVAQLMPDELPNVDVMISQFAGNEEELLQTLQNMAASSPRAADAGQAGNSGSESSDDDEGDEDESEDESEDDGEDDGEDDNSQNGDDEEESDDSDHDEDGDDASDGATENDDDGSGDAESSDGDESGDEQIDGASESLHDESVSASESESDASEESRKAAEAEVAESVYDEESYYSEEVVETDDEEEVESDEETIDDEEETIQSEGEDGGSDDDESSSYESDSD